MSEQGEVSVSEMTRFYLERRKQIEEWNRLRGGAEELRDQVFGELVDELEALAVATDMSLVDVWTGKNARHHILAFNDVGRALERDGTPAAAVAVQWTKWAFPDDLDAASVGIRISHSPADYRSIQARIVGATKDLDWPRAHLTHDWWPFYEDVTAPPEPAWWDDPRPFIDQVCRRTAEHLKRFAPIVRSLLGPQ